MTELTEAPDLVVIGTGNAGQSCARRCARGGWRVTMVENRPPGGTCALRGCDPKKILVDAAARLDHIRRTRGRGVSMGDPKIDWGELMSFKRSLIEPKPERTEKSLREAGIELRRGAARFVEPRVLEVEGERLPAKHLLLATGARPRSLPIPGAELLATSDEFLELPELPERVIFIGGGFISFEFAHVAARAGAKVIIVSRGERVLRAFDAALVEELVRLSEQIGIEVHLGTSAEGIERRGGETLVRVKGPEGERTIPCDLAVHGAGREPALDALNLDAAGIQHTEDGVTVNDHLQSTSNPHVYAAGDCADTGQPMLTPPANDQGRLAALNMIEGNTRSLDRGVIPAVLFSIPPLAGVGHTEESAQAAGLNVRVKRTDHSAMEHNRRIGEEIDLHRVVLNAESGEILGAHLLGPHADETVNLLAVAIRAGLTAKELKAIPLAYPTHSSHARGMV